MESSIQTRLPAPHARRRTSSRSTSGRLGSSRSRTHRAAWSETSVAQLQLNSLNCRLPRLRRRAGTFFHPHESHETCHLAESFRLGELLYRTYVEQRTSSSTSTHKVIFEPCRDNRLLGARFGRARATVVRRFRNRRSSCVHVEWTTGERSSPQACKPQARAPQTDRCSRPPLVWNVSRSAFKRHKATDENAHFCRDAIVRPSAAKGVEGAVCVCPLCRDGCEVLVRGPIGHRTRAHPTRLKRTLNGRVIVPRLERSGDLAEALQLIGAEVQLDGSGRVQDGLRT
jgi:hypothetical protein